MKHSLVAGLVVAIVAALVAAFGGAIGVTTVWPVLLAVAVGVAGGHPTVGRAVAFLVGAVLSLVTLGARAALFPDVASARAGAVVVAVLLIAIIAGASGGRAPMWAGLAGYAAFAGLYEPVFASSPTSFLTDAPQALLVIAIATGVGTIAVQLFALVSGGSSVDESELAEENAL